MLNTNFIKITLLTFLFSFTSCSKSDDDSAIPSSDDEIELDEPIIPIDEEVININMCVRLYTEEEISSTIKDKTWHQVEEKITLVDGSTIAYPPSCYGGLNLYFHDDNLYDYRDYQLGGDVCDEVGYANGLKWSVSETFLILWDNFTVKKCDNEIIKITKIYNSPIKSYGNNLISEIEYTLTH